MHYCNRQKGSSQLYQSHHLQSVATSLLVSLGQQPATQKKQDPSQGKTVGEGDPKKAPLYTTASAAWENSLVSSRGMRSSPALVKGPWGQSRGFYSGAVLGAVKDKHDRSDRGSDVGGIQDGSSDINTGMQYLLLSAFSSCTIKLPIPMISCLPAVACLLQCFIN